MTRPGTAIVVMGVSASGKSVVGIEIARRLHLPFVDADDLHPAENVAKMSQGIPLTDADRMPWLDLVGDRLALRSTGGEVPDSAVAEASGVVVASPPSSSSNVVVSPPSPCGVVVSSWFTSKYSTCRIDQLSPSSTAEDL